MSTKSNPKPLNIAIIGGGISGAVLGIALSKLPNINFKIYESHSAFGEIGAGLALASNAHRSLRLIDDRIWKAYMSRASTNGWKEKEDVWFDFRLGEKGSLGGVEEGGRIIEVHMNKGEENEEGEEKMTTIHRAHFLEELVKLLPEGCAVFEKRLVDIDQSRDLVVCTFSDGTSVTADAVIGCDGIKSSCRPFVYGKDSPLSQPVFTRKVAYRGLVPMVKAEEALGEEMANNRQMYLGHGGHVLTFPIAGGKLLTVVAFHSSRTEDWEGDWVQPLQKQNLQRDFVGWGEKVTKIMDLIQGSDVWAIFDHPPVPTFHKDKLCLLGDAAHATSPHYGQGAGLAIEDTYILSNLLARCTSAAEISAAFKGYDHVRVPRALRVTAMSLEQGKTLDLEGSGVYADLNKLRERLDTAVRWVWDIDFDEHLKEAMCKFDEENAKF